MSFKTTALLTALAAALMAGCASNTAPVRTEPTYQEAASSQFLQCSSLPRGARMTRVGSWRGSVAGVRLASWAFMARAP